MQNSKPREARMIAQAAITAILVWLMTFGSLPLQAIADEVLNEGQDAATELVVEEGEPEAPDSGEPNEEDDPVAAKSEGDAEQDPVSDKDGDEPAATDDDAPAAADEGDQPAATDDDAPAATDDGDQPAATDENDPEAVDGDQPEATDQDNANKNAAPLLRGPAKGGDGQDGDTPEPTRGDDDPLSGDMATEGWKWEVKPVEGNEGKYELTFTYTGEEDPVPAVTIPNNFSANISEQLGDVTGSIIKLTVPEGVTSVGDSAFYALTGLEEAEIGSTVTSIGKGAFGSETAGGGAENLETVTFRTREVEDEEGNISQVSDLATIGQGAFAGTSLTSINLEDTAVKTIGASAFQGCEDLTSITFPETLTNIGNDAFNSCSNLASADFSAITNLDPTLTIGARAFKSCALEELTLPDKTNNIGGNAFEGNKSLTSVDMPARCYLTGGMGSYVFADCTALEDVTFREVADRTKGTDAQYRSIPNYTFNNDTSLKNLDLSGWSDYSVPFTLNNVFIGSDGTNIESIVLPENTNVTIASTAFAGKTGFDDLSAIKNPESVTTIEANAFKGSGITDADLSDWTGITAINAGTFSNCSNLESATIPSGVTSIGKQAFANDPKLSSVTIDSTKLATVAKDAFEGSGRLETVTIGKDVEELTGNIFAAAPSADFKFEGESIIKISKPTVNGSSSPLKDLDGTYWVSPEGVLFELKDDGTAALAYVPNGITSYSVPATINANPDGEHPGGTYAVTKMNPHAVHMADSLTALNFANPRAVTIAPSAFAGRSTSDDAQGLAVNGATEIDPDDFASASVLCDYPMGENSKMRLVPAVEGAYTNSDGVTLSKTIVAINGKNADDDDIYRFKTGQAATYTIAISNEDNIAMNNVVRVYFAYDSPGQQMGSFPVRDEPYNLINPGSGNSYPCKVVETDTPGIYYYEISGIKPGETLAFQNDVFYPSPNTPGGTLRIWTETVTPAQAQALEGKVIDPTDYMQVEWDTDPVTYSLRKSRSYASNGSSNLSPVIRVNGDGEAIVYYVAFRLDESNAGSPARSEGQDFIRWVQYEDIIDLPEELMWRPEVLAALRAGQTDASSGDGWWLTNTSIYVDRNITTNTQSARTINVRAGGKTYPLAYLYGTNTNVTQIMDLTPQLVYVDGDPKIKLTWYVNNSTLNSDTGSATAEYSTRSFYVRVGDNVVLADLDKVSEFIDQNPGKNIQVHNDANETRHYSYSEDQYSESSANTPVTANAGLTLGKSWDSGTGTRVGGMPDRATVTFSNTGIMSISQWGGRVPERDENGNVVKDETGAIVYQKDEQGREITDGVILTDTLPNTHFITGTDMVSMLNATETTGKGDNLARWNVGDWLTITINGASLFTPNQFQPSEGTEQSGKWSGISGTNFSATSDNGIRVWQGAKFVITKDDQGRIIVTLSGDPTAANNKTYVIGEDGDYTSIDALFHAVGFMPTRGTSYSLNYTLTEGFVLKAGQTFSMHILSSTKTTPMMLESDRESRAANVDYITNTASTKANIGGTPDQTRSATTGYRHWRPELTLYKSVSANGSSLSGSPAMVNDGTVVEYSIAASNSGSMVYETQSMHDNMGGASVLLAPVAQNPNLKAPDGSELDRYTAGGVEYYLINKLGTYNNVVVGSTSSNGAQTYVAQTIVVSENTSNGNRTSLNTAIHWKPFTNWGVSPNRTTIYYKALVSAGESGLASKDGGDEAKQYEIYNKGWLGDHQGHRLYDTCWLEYQVYQTNKKILMPDGTTAEYSRLNYGDTVTYRMEIHNHATVPARLTGANIRDALPDTFGVFAWTRGDGDQVAANVTNLRYTSSDEGMRITAGTGANIIQIPVDGTVPENDSYWDVVSSTKTQSVHTETAPSGAAQTRKGGYDIWWPNDFVIVMPPNSTLTIYVDLTFPTRPEEGASEWDQYVAAVRGRFIYNTFYVNDLWDDVSHSLAAEGRAVLYKGVYDTGITTRGTSSSSSSSYMSHRSRLMYSNGIVPTRYNENDLKAETVTYYTVLYNGSYDRLYLSDMQDQLPRGFHFNSMNNTPDATTTLYSGGNYTSKSSSAYTSSNYIGYTGNQLYYGQNDRSYTAYQGFTEGYGNDNRTVYMNNSGDPIDENSITYVNARITATVTQGEDGREHITFRPSGASAYRGYRGLHYDSAVGKYYLNPGEALRFGYNVVIGEYAQTDDFATNTIAMPYYDYYGMDFTLDVPDENGEGGAVQNVRAVSGIRNNDGTCTLMEGSEVAENYGMNVDPYTADAYNSHEGGNWLVSDVTLERAPVIPGMQKVLGGLTKKVDNTPDTTVQGSRYDVAEGSLYGTRYSGGAKTNDVVNWRLRVFNEAGTGNDDIVSQLVNFTVTDTVVTPYAFCGQVFYNMYRANGANGVRVTPSSVCLFTLGSRTEGDTQVLVGAGASPNSSGSRYINIGSAEDDSDDDWFAFASGTREGYVKIERNADGEEVLTIQLKGRDYAVPAGHWLDICVHTMYVRDEVIISEGKYNDVVLTTEQNYDPERVAQGRALTDQEYDSHGNLVTVNKGIQSGASIMLTQGYTTTSWKTITENGNASNTARSDGSPTYITIPEKSKTFRYDMYVIGPAVPMSKIVIIDHLPEPEDHSAFVAADRRNSDFAVSFDADNLNFVLSFTPGQGGGERTLVAGTDYTIEVSNKVEFDRDTDWRGTGEGWIDITGLEGEELQSVLSEARSFRVVLADPDGFKKQDMNDYMMVRQCRIHIGFNACIEDPDAAPGQIAWNSFGYRYQVPQTFNGTEQNSYALELEAQTLNVGVKYPSAPRLQKQLVTLTQAMVPKTEEVVVEEFEPVIGEDGEPLIDEEGNPVMQPKMVPVIGEDGEPVLDDEGNPVMEQATHTEIRTVTHEVEYPIYDTQGNPVLDEEGNQMVETVEEPVMVPAEEPELDEEGNPVLDEEGNPVMKPVMELTAHPAAMDLSFAFLVYRGQPIPELDNSLEMTNAEIAAVLEAAERDYTYVPFEIKEGSSSADAGLWKVDYRYTYDEETDSFVPVDADGQSWFWLNGGIYTFVELPMGDYDYEIEMLKAGRVESVENNMRFENSSSTVIQLVCTNEWVPEYIDVEGTKVWGDADNQDGIRPASITIHLFADGEEIDSTTVTEEDDWAWSFEHLLKNKEDGTKIEYTITEEEVEEYTTAIVGDADGYRYTVANAHEPYKTEVPVIKVWDDADDQDGIRPGSITVHLVADGEDTGKTIELTAETGWEGTFEDLDLRKAGVDIVYTVYEDIPDGYSVAIVDNSQPEEPEDDEATDPEEGQQGEGTDGEGGDTPGTTEDPQPEDPEAEETPKGFTITNTHEPELTNVSGSKTWDDASNQDGVRPESITIRLLADGKEIDSITVTTEDDWVWLFEGLPKYRDHGTEIVYVVTEDAMPDYTATYNGFDVVNTHTPDETSITVVKAWDDANDQDGVRPEVITVRLYADGKDTGFKLELTAENGWQGSFTGLPVNRDEGTAIVYTITEDSVEGYETAIAGDAETGFVVANAHIPELMDVTVSKVWDDANNANGIRPSSVKVTLVADGKRTGDTLVLSEENKWAGTFEELPKYRDGGEEIVYTVEELEVPDGYEVSVSGDAASGLVVTNTHTPTTPDTGDVTVAVWPFAVAGGAALIASRRLRKREE